LNGKPLGLDSPALYTHHAATGQSNYGLHFSYPTTDNYQKDVCMHVSNLPLLTVDGYADDFSGFDLV